MKLSKQALGLWLWLTSASAALAVTTPYCPTNTTNTPCGSEVTCNRGADIKICEDFSDPSIFEFTSGTWGWHGADAAASPCPVTTQQHSCYINTGGFDDANAMRGTLHAAGGAGGREDADTRFPVTAVDGRAGVYVRYMLKLQTGYETHGSQKNVYLQHRVDASNAWSVMIGMTPVENPFSSEAFFDTDCHVCVDPVPDQSKFWACVTAADCPAPATDTCNTDGHCIKWKRTGAEWGASTGLIWTGTTTPTASNCTIPHGQWVQVEAYIKCEASPVADNTGALRLWLNGKLCMDYQNVGGGVAGGGGGTLAKVKKNVCYSTVAPTGYRGSDPFDVLWFSYYWGGSNPTPTYSGTGGQQDLWYDNAIISTAPIGGPLSSPTVLTLTGAATKTAVPLSWTDNATSETGFQLERRLDTAGTWTPITVTADTDTAPSAKTYTDAPGFGGLIHYRVASRVGASTLSWYTNELNVTIKTLDAARGVSGRGVRFGQTVD